MSPRNVAALTLFAALSLSFAAGSGMAAPAATMAPAAIDAGVPVTRKALPKFPYIEWPEKLEKKYRRAKREDFDRAWFVAGTAPYAAEGQLNRRSYLLRDAKMSRIEATRNYETALKELGAVRIDTVRPQSGKFVIDGVEKGKKAAFLSENFGIHGGKDDYSTYLIRTPETRVWIGLTISDARVWITTLEEKKMEQSVALTKADEMKAALDKQGYVALYINFDTDKADLRDDGKPAVDEIARLLKTNPGLKIAVEGHTDNSGDARRNKALSEQRAATIVAALKGSGIDAARLKSAGHGADKPIADNRTEEGRAQNRRVELVKM